MLQKETHHQSAQCSHHLPNPSKLKISLSDLLLSLFVKPNVNLVLVTVILVMNVMPTEPTHQSVIVLMNTTQIMMLSVNHVHTNVPPVLPPLTVSFVLETEKNSQPVLVHLVLMTPKKPPVHHVTTDVLPVPDKLIHVLPVSV